MAQGSQMKASKQSARNSDLPTLPRTVLSKDRQTIDLTSDVWRFYASNDGGRLIELDWTLLERDISPRLLSFRARYLFKL
jgi:hypothetical protein